MGIPDDVYVNLTYEVEVILTYEVEVKENENVVEGKVHLCCL